MPLLMCPNCQANMTTLNRSNVEFDMCPSCRGVWLDRGELEKLMEGARTGDTVQQPYPPQQQPPRQPYYGDQYGERGYGAHGKRKRGMDIFDIFD